MTNHENRNSRQIQSDIDHTRSRVDEAIDAMQKKFSPGQLMDEAFDYFRRSGPSDFASNFGATVRDNPVPATLVGLGLGWLMISGSSAGTAGATRASSIHETSGSDSLSRSGLDSAREKTGMATDKAKGYAENAQSKAKDIAGTAQHKTEEAMHNVSAKLHHMSNDAQASKDKMSRGMVRARGQLAHIMNEQPLVLGALGLALGAALGAGLPSTEMEDELMGQTRDDVVDKASETGKQQYEKAKSSAQSVKDAALHQADKEGLTPNNEDKSKHGGKYVHNTPPKEAPRVK